MGGRSHAKDSDAIWREEDHLEVLSGNVFVVYVSPEACQNQKTDLDTSFRIRTICPVTSHAASLEANIFLRAYSRSAPEHSQAVPVPFQEPLAISLTPANTRYDTVGMSGGNTVTHGPPLLAQHDV